MPPPHDHHPRRQSAQTRTFNIHVEVWSRYGEDRFSGTRDVLRVWVTASPDVRTARIAEQSGSSPAEARRTVERTDTERAA
jgi:cytidylate kinase